MSGSNYRALGMFLQAKILSPDFMPTLEERISMKMTPPKVVCH
jgi:hypothetical protein